MLDRTLSLLCIFAHPDDESLGVGGTLAYYAAQGVETHLVTATRGQRGWFGDEANNPGLVALGEIREGELMAAARVLGVSSVTLLDYVDGDLDQAPVGKITAEIAVHLRRVRPQVVITFGPEGAYGHPDHIAISQFAASAIVRAADGAFAAPTGLPPHAVSKFYFMAYTALEYELYESVFGSLAMHIDGVERRSAPWTEWAVTTRVDTSEYWRTVREAVTCHRSQLPGYDALLSLPDETLWTLWKHDSYYRVFSTVNGGRKRETDLFEGLR